MSRDPVEQFDQRGGDRPLHLVFRHATARQRRTTSEASLDALVLDRRADATEAPPTSVRCGTHRCRRTGPIPEQLQHARPPSQREEEVVVLPTCPYKTARRFWNALSGSSRSTFGRRSLSFMAKASRTNERAVVLPSPRPTRAAHPAVPSSPLPLASSANGGHVRGTSG